MTTTLHLAGRVPVARRALFQDRRRAGLASGGVAAALLLVLMLQGIVDGTLRQVTSYLRDLPADVIVSEKDVRTMHMSVSTLDPAVPSAVARVDGVAWAEGIRYTTTALVADGDRQQLSYVLGYDPATGRGGPHRPAAGRPPGAGEILLEQIAAERLNVRPGDAVRVFDDTYRVSGLFRGGTTITNSIAFIPTDDFAAHRGPALAYVLVGARPGVDADQLARRIAAAVPGATVQTRDGFADQEGLLVKDMSADLMQIMAVMAFLIALAVIGLTLFTLTLTKLREHAIVKALGAPTHRLAAVILTQATWSIALAVVLATGLAIGLGRLVGTVSPATAVAIEPGSVLRVTLAALAVGALGALAPLRRVITVDPASAFRRTT